MGDRKLIAIAALLLWTASAGATFRPCPYGPLAKGHYETDTESRTEGDREFLSLYHNDDAFARWLTTQTDLPEKPDDIVARYKHFRTLQQISQKPDPGEVPKAETVDLTGYGANLPETAQNPGLGGLKRALVRQLRLFGIGAKKELPMSNYNAAVMTLRKGDTVKFGDKTFKLGRYLGAGNETHIYEVDGQPDVVLRIPFLERTGTQQGLHPDHGMQAFLFKFYGVDYAAKASKSGLNYVKLKEEGQGYTLVEKVNGSENGLHFAKALEKKYGEQRDDFPMNEAWANAMLTKAREAQDTAAVERLEKLVQQLKALEQHALAGDARVNARQFVYDTERGDWWLVDFN